MKLSEFNFDLPEELIAKHPVENRDEARMMVVHKDTGEIEHKHFKDLIDYFDTGDVMVFNNTKVFRLVCMETKKRQVLKLKYSYFVS